MDEVYALTDQGFHRAVAIIGEFCHGFTIEEIASNTDFDEDEIKVMLLTLVEGYALAYGLGVDE